MPTYFGQGSRNWWHFKDGATDVVHSDTFAEEDEDYDLVAGMQSFYNNED